MYKTRVVCNSVRRSNKGGKGWCLRGRKRIKAQYGGLKMMHKDPMCCGFAPVIMRCGIFRRYAIGIRCSF